MIIAKSPVYRSAAGVDHDTDYVNLNDHTFEMPTNFTTSQQITDYLVSKNVYKLTGKDSQIVYKPNPKSIGDNMVGFLSPIGWIGDNPDVNTPELQIQMEKIFIDVDTNGGNGDGIPGLEVLNLLHNKIPHRDDVIKQILYYLSILFI